MSRILDKHVPLKKFSIYKLKFKTKHWITAALQKSISTSKKLFSNFINKKYLIQKTELRIKYKSYRNMLSTLMEKVNKSLSAIFLKII